MKKINLPIQKEDIADKVDEGKEFVIKAKDQAVNLAEFAREKAGDAYDKYLYTKYGPVNRHEADTIMDKPPEIIRVIDSDDERHNIDLFKDAVGFRKRINGMDVLEIYAEHMRTIGVAYYPHDAEPLYYRDPYNNADYIALSDFYNHLKEARVNELKLIAQKLGAKHIKIEYKEETESVFSEAAKAKVKGKAGKKKGIEAEGEHHKKEDEFSSTKILAETNLEPSDTPTEPKLIYLAGSKSIQTLITMRTNPGEGGKIENDTYRIFCKSLKGISEKNAIKIDGVLKQFKIGGNVSVASMVEKQNREMFEYTIKF